MPNGFHGSIEEWERMESPLRQIDLRLVKFARAHNLSVRENYHSWPERSLLWSRAGLERSIQIFLRDEKEMTFCLWLCVWEDRGGVRYWKQKYLLDHAPWGTISDELESLLPQAYQTVDNWVATDLECAG